MGHEAKPTRPYIGDRQTPQATKESLESGNPERSSFEDASRAGRAFVEEQLTRC
jgi:hypothetical protein